MLTRRTMMGSILLAATAGQAQAAEREEGGVRSTFAFEARVTVGAPTIIGQSVHGLDASF